MSRSRRHTPIRAITISDSDKYYKVRTNRIMRQQTKIALKKNIEPPQRKSEIEDAYLYDKDGKHYISKDSEHYDYKKIMRK